MKKLILDIDSVGDDILAVLFGLTDQNINIDAITTVTGASGDIQHATWVALNTIEVTGQVIPVYAGESKPLEYKESDVEGDPVNFYDAYKEKFGKRLEKFNEVQTEPTHKEEEESAVDFIIRTVLENKNETTIVTTGPLTNLAQAMLKEPEIENYIEHAFVLGGAFKVPANITPVAEYNIYADPEAANIVLNSNIPITLVPLDVCETNQVADSMLTRDDLYDIETFGNNTPVEQFIVDKFPIYIDIWREKFKFVGFPMDDIITLALVAYPELCTYTDWVHVDVETQGDLARGQTIAHFGEQILNNPHKNKKNVRIADSIDGRKFMQLFKSAIANP